MLLLTFCMRKIISTACSNRQFNVKFGSKFLITLIMQMYQKFTSNSFVESGNSRLTALGMRESEELNALVQKLLLPSVYEKFRE